MANTEFLFNLTFNKQGTITGPTKRKSGDLDYSSGLKTHAFGYAIEAPLDSSSGPVTGKRQHKPISITKEVDGTSPLLWQALCTNETFQSIKLEFATPGSGKKNPPIRTIELKNGSITNIVPAPSKIGKKLEKITLKFEDLLVNNNPQLFIPHYS